MNRIGCAVLLTETVLLANFTIFVFSRLKYEDTAIEFFH